MSDTKSLEERLRAKGRERFQSQVREAVGRLRALSGIVTAVPGIYFKDGNRYKDATDQALLEAMQAHIIKTKSIQAEEEEISDFMEKVEGNLIE